MNSKTKYKTDEQTLTELFAAAGIYGGKISALGAGEFNAVFQMTGGNKDAVIKIAPDNSCVQTYEQNMLNSELFWYGKLREHTDIKLPEIYLVDTSGERIPVAYFVMEKLDGVTLDKAKLTADEKDEMLREIARTAAKLHRIKNDKFGYIVQPLYDDWYQAIRGMTALLMADAAKRGKRPKCGLKLLSFIDKHQSVLEKAECSMVNFDLWKPNFVFNRLGGKAGLSLIDPERGFWGDRIADFICLEFMKLPADKTLSINAYNSIAEQKIAFSYDETIRYAVALGYLGVLMHTERYYRYSRLRWGWWRNTLMAKYLLSRAFKLLGGAGEAPGGILG